LKDEKVLMKKFKNVFTEPELEKWISENVRGLGEQDPSKIVKNLFKKNIIEKVALTSFIQFC